MSFTQGKYSEIMFPPLYPFRIITKKVRPFWCSKKGTVKGTTFTGLAINTRMLFEYLSRFLRLLPYNCKLSLFYIVKVSSKLTIKFLFSLFGASKIIKKINIILKSIQSEIIFFYHYVCWLLAGGARNMLKKIDTLTTLLWYTSP